MINTEQALVPASTFRGQPEPTQVDKVNGHRLSPAKPAKPAKSNPAAKMPAPNPAPAPLSDELVNAILKGRGLRGWLRAANIGRVLGLLSLYLFLDTYDVRANFNRRAAERRREQARARG